MNEIWYKVLNDMFYNFLQILGVLLRFQVDLPGRSTMNRHE